MFKFHIKCFFRTLLQGKSLTAINLFGLIAGIFVSLLVWIYVSNELSYDSSFTNSNRIFRIIRNWQGSAIFDTSLPAPLGGAMETEIPEVIASTRVFSSVNNMVVKEYEVFREDIILVVDPSFFKVFGIPLYYGDTATCLNSPNEVAISTSTALRIFKNEDVIGENLSIESGELGISDITYTITGIYEDFLPNCHFNPNFLISSSSFGFMDNPSHNNHFLQTYILLENADQKEQVENKLPDFMKDFYGSDYYNFSRSSFLLQTTRDIHLDSKVYPAEYETAKGSYFAVRFFPSLAIIIIFISLVNFINLYTSQSLCRRKEIWLKKVNGATSFSEISFFIIDSIIIFIFCLVIALCLVEVSDPWFEKLTGRQLDMRIFLQPGNFIPGISIILLLGVVAGLYPALILVSSKTMKDQEIWRGFRTIGVFFNSRLIILQFTMCIVFLVGSIMVYKQFRFLEHEMSRGFNKENIMLIRNPWYLGNSTETFKQTLVTHSNIIAVTSSESVPGIDNFSVWGHPVDSALNDIHITVFYCDYDYSRALNLNIVEGRFFSDKYASDNLAIVLNETAVKQLGWKESIGKKYRLDTVYQVIGVVQDIHFESLYNTIAPMGMVLIAPGTESFISLKTAPGTSKDVVTFVSKTWESFVPDRPIEYTFMDAELSAWYNTDRRIGIITSQLSVLAIVLSCLGLLGIILYSILRRSKELAIRKVNGARSRDIYSLFSLDIGKWLLIAFIIEIPISLFALRKWLQSFAYRTDISWWIFLISLVIMFIVTFSTILVLGGKISRQNPVNSLRYE